MKTYSQEDFKAWGKKGGHKRSKAMTAEQRIASARKAAKARWKAKRA